MDSQDLQVLAALRGWAAEGHRAALVTVACTWGSAPRPAGAWMALRDDGRVQGSVSGGCIEDDLVARMRDGRIAGSQPFVLTYGVSRDEAARFGLPCGGTLELVVEPAPDLARLADLARRQLTERAAGSDFLASLDLPARITLLPGNHPLAAIGAALVGRGAQWHDPSIVCASDTAALGRSDR